tara:strand:- start:29 stop:304 length:276 start_codon:yes stop_codon:yes gene_type:complete
MKNFLLVIFFYLITSTQVLSEIDSDLYNNIKTGCLYTAQMNGDESIESKNFCTCMANVYNSYNNNTSIEELLTNSSKNNQFMREYVMPKCT